MQKLTLFLSIFCLLTLLLSGCDWRLRGSGANYATLPKVFLDGSDNRRNLGIYREIYAILMSQEALASHKQADVRLIIVNQDINRRTVSVNKSARAAEFQLTLKVPFKILDKEGVVLRESTVVLTRSYSFNEQDIVGKSKEEALLKKEMVSDAARQILRQL